MDEPSLYDYIKSFFNHSAPPLDLPRDMKNLECEKEPAFNQASKINNKKSPRLIFAGFLVVIAQFLLEPNNRRPLLSILIYVCALYLIWTSLKSESNQNKTRQKRPVNEIGFKPFFLVVSLIAQVVAFILFQDNRFNLINLVAWLVGIVGIILAFWEKTDLNVSNKPKQRRLDWLYTITGLVAICAIIFVRTFQVTSVPAEMYSDHAEKLLDIMDIFAGKFSVFFERNTGREPIQFYFTALIIQLFDTGFTFLSLKIGTIIFGLLTLIFVFLIGRNFGGKWVGLASVFFAGIAYWPNVISRVGLRYALYPFFTAAALYFLIKGLQQSRHINDFLWCGIFVGLGLHGYSSFRIVPVLVAVILLLEPVWRKDPKLFSRNLTLLILIGLISFSIFLPLFRYWFDNPYLFSYRMLTRLTPIERQFEEPAFLTLAKNTISSLLMPFWDNGAIWVHSIPGRPALDFISAGFYFFGLIIFIWRALSHKNGYAAILLISTPLLMLPSILSIAYPGENPSLNRGAGAYVPIFIIAGTGFTYFIQAIHRSIGSKWRSIISVMVTIFFLAVSFFQNHQLVFNQYKTQFQNRAWNTSEIGQVIAGFLQANDNSARAYVIPYPHWVDTRLVGFTAGFPGKDFALWREDILLSQTNDGPQVFIHKPEDDDTAITLAETYPQGSSAIFYSEVPGKEFIIYTVMKY